MDEIYKYHKNGDEWVIRRHHLDGYEGVGAANGEIEARAICAAMNCCIRLVLWSTDDDFASQYNSPESLSMAVESAKRAVLTMRQST
jgi:hypothetical protein